MTLFQTGDFTLASGQKSTWKIECDALTPEDWAGLAAMAVQFLPAFGAVLGVPRGGLPLARALERYATVGKTLVVDDVWTTGGSMKRFIAERNLEEYFGLVAFARNPPQSWVTALFTMSYASLEAVSAAQGREEERLRDALSVAQANVAGLRAAVRKHRDQRGDDRCWLDDEELYQALPEGYTPPARDSAVELANCQRFIACRQNPATQYVSPEREIERLRVENARLHAAIDPTVSTPAEQQFWDNAERDHS